VAACLKEGTGLALACVSRSCGDCGSAQRVRRYPCQSTPASGRCGCGGAGSDDCGAADVARVAQSAGTARNAAGPANRGEAQRRRKGWQVGPPSRWEPVCEQGRGASGRPRKSGPKRIGKLGRERVEAWLGRVGSSWAGRRMGRWVQLGQEKEGRAGVFFLLSFLSISYSFLILTLFPS